MQSKAFFFVKKKQKTFINWCSPDAAGIREPPRPGSSPPSRVPRPALKAYKTSKLTKVFLLLFLQKKKTLPGVQCA
jgi:hypothetical protein